MKILGQKNVIQYILNGVQQHRLCPSLLFVGSEGVGKKTTAFELAKYLSCSSPIKTDNEEELPHCNECRACQKMGDNNHPDLLVINWELQANLVKGKTEAQKVIKIETIRHISKFLSFKPLETNKRIVIIEEAHTLTNEAANALLKILEEPPFGTQLLLLAQDEGNLPSTILSRCAILRFRPIPSKDIATWLTVQEGLAFDQAQEIADLASGSFAKALRLKNQDPMDLNLSDYSLDEFFELLSEPSFRREGRPKAEKVLLHLIERAQKKLEEGDCDQADKIRKLLEAKKQIERFVSPRLVLENLFLTISSTKQ